MELMYNLEKMSPGTAKDSARLFCELWESANYEEELEICLRVTGDNNKCVILAWAGGLYIGFVFMSLRHEYVEGVTTSPVAYIEGLYVKPEYRGKGIGSHLVRAGSQWGKEMGGQEIASDAEIANTISIDFHKKLGFTEVRRVVCFARSLDTPF